MLRSICAESVPFVLVLVIAGGTFAADRDKAKPTEPTPAEVAAREHVQQALFAESLGDNDERAKRLAAASLAQPNLPEAHWHLGRVQVSGKWLPLADAEALAAEDANLRKYRQQRDAAKNPKMLLNLARWCAKTGFGDAARLHYAQVLGNSDATDEMRAEAIKSLKLWWVGDAWITEDELAAREEKSKSMEVALKTWRPRLQKLQQAIDGDDFDSRRVAIDQLHGIDDATVIPALESFLTDGGDRFQEEVVKQLAEFPQVEATLALARFAVLSPFLSAAEPAITALRKRSVHEYCPLLLDGLRAPLHSEFAVQRMPNGEVTYTHVLTRDLQDRRLTAVSANLAAPQFVDGASIRLLPRTRLLVRDDTIWHLQSRLAQNAYQNARNIELAATLANDPINQSNRRVFRVLRDTTGEKVPDDAAKWWQWWQDYNQYHWPKPQYFAYSSNYSQYETPRPMYVVSGSCFVVGTPVRTQTGFVAIETIQPGDRVLAQDQDTGELTYKLVLRTTLRPPADMLKIKAGSEEIVTTLGHPFWVNSHGWRMAKQLKEGDLLHSVSGAIRIDAVEAVPKQPAHNLVVADFNTYFVGQQGLLVHDNEYRKPTRAIVPGLVANP
jgi:hypothetical protein